MKRGSSPAASGRARRIRAQKPWIVLIQAASASRARSCSPSATKRRRTRSRSSPAAFSVNVSASTAPTATSSFSTASTKRSTITAVLPEPAFAASRAEPVRSSIAARCSPVKRTAGALVACGRRAPRAPYAERGHLTSGMSRARQIPG